MTYAAVSQRRATLPPMENYLSFIAYCFLLFVVVDINPFPEHDQMADVFQHTTIEGEGEPVRRAILGTLFALTLPVTIYRWPQIVDIVKQNALLIGILAWCLLSATWAIAPDISIRRSLGLVIMTTILVTTATLSPTRLLNVLIWVTGTYMLADYIGVFMLPAQRVIQYDGAWRGLHSQKNVAGFHCVLAALIWFQAGMARRSLILLGGAVLWLFFLYMTVSKTSIALLAILLVFYFFLDRMIRKGMGKTETAVLLAAILVLVPVGGFLLEWLAPEFLSDVSFTGRTKIWAFVWKKIMQAPLLGYGYNSFWAIDYLSPARIEANYKDVGAYTEGHNGFLDILVTLGVIGLIPVLIFMLRPLILFFRHDYTKLAPPDQTAMGVFINLLFFAVMHNSMESSILIGMDVVWDFALLSILYISIFNARLQATRGSGLV